HDQRAALVEIAEALGWHVAAVHSDLAGHARVLALAAAEGAAPSRDHGSSGRDAVRERGNARRNVKALRSRPR
ncbi:MAG TPA: hypothetical protein VMV37_11100, partial [Gammaproteobacteria bacterium]|nr:hypothetical protein [Gammaproteobacteria bacterium]